MKGTIIALKVPGCIIHSSHNYIINSRHPEYTRVKLIDRINFKFDSRLKNDYYKNSMNN